MPTLNKFKWQYPKRTMIKSLKRFEQRANAIELWLQENGGGALDEQRHLDAGTLERVYWHFGYMVALRDAIRLLTGQSLKGVVESVWYGQEPPHAD